MYVVGTDGMTVLDGANAPTGPRHAVARDGLLLCRPLRPRFAWPALTWEGIAGGNACQACVDVAIDTLAPADDAYPAEPAFVPAQAASALEPSQR